MQLHYIFAAGLLVQSVYVLRHNTLKLSGFFKLCQLVMRDVRLCIKAEHLVTVESVKLLRMLPVKCMAQDGLGRIIILLIIKSVHASEIRYATLG